MIARLENGNVIPCPKQGRDGRGGLHMNLPQFYLDNPHRAAEDGFCPVRFTKQPQGKPVGRWTLRDGEIVQAWSAPEPKAPARDEIPALLERIGDALQRLCEAVCAANAFDK